MNICTGKSILHQFPSLINKWFGLLIAFRNNNLHFLIEFWLSNGSNCLYKAERRGICEPECMCYITWSSKSSCWDISAKLTNTHLHSLTTMHVSIVSKSFVNSHFGSEQWNIWPKGTEIWAGSTLISQIISRLKTWLNIIGLLPNWCPRIKCEKGSSGRVHWRTAGITWVDPTNSSTYLTWK